MPTMSFSSVRRLLLQLPLRQHIRRFLSFAALRDLILSFFFIRHGLLPRTFHLFLDSDADIATRMHVWVPARRGGKQIKPALVLVHGFGGNAKWQWERQVGPLSRHFDLYIPDLVFFGESRSDSHDRSVAFQARCVAAAMAHLDVRRYSVLGISYGGYVAYRIAAEAGAVDKVVIMTSGVIATAEQRKEMVEREGKDLVSDTLLPRRPEELRALVSRSMHRPPRWIPDFFLQDFIEMMYLDQRKERVELLAELLENGADMDPLPVLTQETLLLWGDNDKVFPLRLAHQLKRHLGEKSSLEIIKDAGHALQLEKHKEVNRLIQSFLLHGSVRKSF